jgi:hypothetical protein
MNGTTPYERLMAEQIPTRPRRAPKPEPPPKPIEPWTTAEQNAHWAALCEAVGIRSAKRPHLRLVTEPLADADVSKQAAS